MAAEADPILLETGIVFNQILSDINEKNLKTYAKLRPYGNTTNKDLKEKKDMKEIFWVDQKDNVVGRAKTILIGEVINKENENLKFKFGQFVIDHPENKMKQIFDMLPDKIKNKTNDGILEISEIAFKLLMLKIQEIGRLELVMGIDRYFFGCHDMILKLVPTTVLEYMNGKKVCNDTGIEITDKLLDTEKKLKQNSENLSGCQIKFGMNKETGILHNVIFEKDNKVIDVGNIVVLGVYQEKGNLIKLTFSDYTPVARKEDKDIAKEIFNNLPEALKKKCEHGVIELENMSLVLMILKIMEQENYEMILRVGGFMIGVYKPENVRKAALAKEKEKVNIDQPQ